MEGPRWFEPIDRFCRTWRKDLAGIAGMVVPVTAAVLLAAGSKYVALECDTVCGMNQVAESSGERFSVIFDVISSSNDDPLPYNEQMPQELHNRCAA